MIGLEVVDSELEVDLRDPVPTAGRRILVDPRVKHRSTPSRDGKVTLLFFRSAAWFRPEEKIKGKPKVIGAIIEDLEACKFEAIANANTPPCICFFYAYTCVAM